MEELKKNQENSNWGGAREGAGRPKGSNKENLLVEKIKEILGEDKINDLIVEACNRANKSDKILIFILEQIFGKARQTNTINFGDDESLELVKNLIYGGLKPNTTVQDKRATSDTQPDSTGDIQSNISEGTPESPSDTTDTIR
jgi:hypothetical protein